MPVFNHYYPDDQNQINTPDSAARLAQDGPTLPVAVGPTPAHVEALQRSGLAVPVPVFGSALIDTGSAYCLVDEEVVVSLGIPQYGVTTIHTAGGIVQCPTYPASLSFPGTPLPNITFLDFLAAPLRPAGIIAIIGRNALKDFLLIYNGLGRSISLAY